MRVLIYLVVLLNIGLVYGHGFLAGIGRLYQDDPLQVRNADAIDSLIDSLRNPIGDKTMCRGHNQNIKPKTLRLGKDIDVTLTLAMSLGAQHVGPCKVELYKYDNHDEPAATLTSGVECAKSGTDGPLDMETDKTRPASEVCSDRVPHKLVTNDMCLFHWTFRPELDTKIRNGKYILRWSWKATHLGDANAEYYENCIDVEVRNADDDC
ncbi:hypothetical protein HDU85_005914 [Gaertneriomyces sp. JEL0708]|nr:hypothetical protein HDU85_005914 [Gaertneriomyces sp. JEL0708]